MMLIAAGLLALFFCCLPSIDAICRRSLLTQGQRLIKAIEKKGPQISAMDQSVYHLNLKPGLIELKHKKNIRIGVTN